MYNLTDSQKELAKWLVQNVRDGNLNETFKIVFWFNGFDPDMSATIFSYKGNQDINRLNLTQGHLKVLSENDLLSYEKTPSKDEAWNCTLKGSIYKAVDNDFNSPDTSFIDYLSPLANPSGFDEELADRCFPILATGSSNPKSWDTAVRNAGVVLEARLRDVGRIPDPKRLGRDLVNDIFGDNGTLTSKFPVPSERQGYRELHAGIVGVFRNSSAHHFRDPSPEEGGAFIVFINLLLKKLEDLR